MAQRNVIMLHILEHNIYEFYGSPASLYDKHSSAELLISQKSLHNFHFRNHQRFAHTPDVPQPP